ncbi:hypothetical protein DFP72DRAFT_830671 [Ephemerocybe angulata]|uniref:DUF6589 domain-containing protein n=1 Tax=Ephemerocybe angulata TaxID=980116 RepID=A0A8H6LV61_9AGAR|nr:hypothetical protein DFP72DRAFT_830671 [Tulosesus angulatus]
MGLFLFSCNVRVDFYPGHHILEDRFDALILDALRCLIIAPRLSCEKKTKIITPENTYLLDCLPQYFGPGKPLEAITFDELKTMAERVYDQYLTFASAEMFHEAADETVEGVESEAVRSENMDPHGPTDEGDTETAVPNTDATLSNNIHFLRMTFWYLEMCAGIAEGDIGRVFEIIKLLRFSFWGAGSTNYGNELLEQACNFLYEFSDDLKTAIFNNYLVNPSGIPGHWFELDLLQEHFNYWLKRLFNSKSHDFDSRHLSEAVGLNIRGFSLLRDRFPSIFGFRRNKGKHTDPEKIFDINTLGAHYRKEGVLVFKKDRSQPYKAIDEFGQGMNILAGGKLKAFLLRTMNDGPVMETDHEEDEAEILDASQLPVNPVVSLGVAMEASDFVEPTEVY